VRVLVVPSEKAKFIFFGIFGKWETHPSMLKHSLQHSPFKMIVGYEYHANFANYYLFKEERFQLLCGYFDQLKLQSGKLEFLPAINCDAKNYSLI